MIYFFFFQPPPPAGPALAAAPSALTFSTTEGIQPPTQQISITNIGDGTLNWTAVAAGLGLSVAPPAGTAPSTLTVTLNVSGLLPGVYAGSVTITSPGATGSPVTIPVTTTILSAGGSPVLGVTPLTLTFTAQQGSQPAPQSVSVVDLGPASPFPLFTWTATPVGSGVTVVPTTGTPPGGFLVSIDTTGMGVGVHTRSVVVTTVP